MMLFPSCGGSFAFYPEQLAEGLKVTRIEELWLCLTNEANVVLDVSPYWETRLEALKQHVSQIGDPEEFVRKWNERRKEITGTDDSYYEQFRRVILRGFMNLLTLAKAQYEQILADRRILHQYPELSKQEEQTAQFIQKRLNELGFVVEEKIAGDWSGGSLRYR